MMQQTEPPSVTAFYMVTSLNPRHSTTDTAYCIWEAAECGSSLWVPAHKQETCKMLLALNWTSSDHLAMWGVNQQADFFISVSPILCTNKNKIK